MNHFGYTLVELILSMAFGFIAITAISTGIYKFQKGMNQRTRATVYTSGLVEAFRSLRSDVSMASKVTYGNDTNTLIFSYETFSLSKNKTVPVQTIWTKVTELNGHPLNCNRDSVLKPCFVLSRTDTRADSTVYFTEIINSNWCIDDPGVTCTFDIAFPSLPTAQTIKIVGKRVLAEFAVSSPVLGRETIIIPVVLDLEQTPVGGTKNPVLLKKGH